MVTSLKKWGNSQGVRFSKETLEAIGLRVDDRISITVDTNSRKIIISKAEDKKVDLEKLFKAYTGDFKGEEFDWGPKQGDEVW